MTNDDMQIFQTLSGGVGLTLAHLDPHMDRGVVPAPADSHQVIACNKQFFSLADQDNAGLKTFLNSLPTCHDTLAEAVQA